MKNIRYAVVGKLHKNGNRIFIETELDENNEPCGTYLNEVIDNIPENAKVSIVIDFKQ